jgi:hypothetical protein
LRPIAPFASLKFRSSGPLRVEGLARDDGQVLIWAAASMVAFIAIAGLVLDVGSWYLKQRDSQTTVDAAALAGAQALPSDPEHASELATSYADDNGGIAGATITIGTKFVPNDMITLTQTRTVSGLFSKVVGIGSVEVHAHATAIAEIPTEVIGVAPIAVKITHPQLSGAGCPCFGVPTTLDLGKQGAPGAFDLIDLDTDKNGTDGASTVAKWISAGFDRPLPLGGYYSRPGAAFNSNNIQSALQDRIGTELLFPIYDTLTGSGANASYHVIAWAAFHLTASEAQGNSGTLNGYFSRVIWKGIVSTTGPPSGIPDLGVRSVALIN